MNRLTAIGLASLVAYGLLIATKYTSVVSATRPETASPARLAAATPGDVEQPVVVNPEPMPRHVPFAAPSAVRLPEPPRASAIAIEFRQARDLKAFADGLLARKATLTADERYHLAKALEECQFATSLTEDIAAYAAKQRRQFLAGLPINDPNNAKRIAAYEAVDNTQRCARFQGAKISQKDIDDLLQQAAQEGDVRAQARMLVAELNTKNQQGQHSSDPAPAGAVRPDDLSRIIGLLQSRDPEAMMIVGQFLAQSSVASQLRIGPNGEVPEPSAFLGAFSLVACDLGPDCTSLSREPQLACAYGGYCNSTSFEELYQNFLASPWAYAQAVRYRGIIHTAINTQDWSLIGLQPPSTDKRRTAAIQ
ncbi:MAG TPA: hypothetical protein VFJ86_04730 [Usitatibacter sp.]|jgi:hypothetical protein|nr:hypothetical protein [Usitatibacter sp.]